MAGRRRAGEDGRQGGRLFWWLLAQEGVARRQDHDVLAKLVQALPKLVQALRRAEGNMNRVMCPALLRTKVARTLTTLNSLLKRLCFKGETGPSGWQERISVLFERVSG